MELKRLFALPLLCLVCAPFADAGAREARPVPNLRSQVMAPYDLLSSHLIGNNYLENLYDPRLQLLAFAPNVNDLHFTVDNTRVISALVDEAEFTPIVRIELIQRLTEGILAAEAPGFPGKYFHKHRDGKINYLAKADTPGWLRLVYAWDTLSPVTDIGFTVGDARAEELELVDRNPRYGTRMDRKSPIVIERDYGETIRLLAEYRNGNEDVMPLIEISGPAGEEVSLLIGDGENEMRWFGRIPGAYVVETPDGEIPADRDRDILSPDFQYVIIRKDTEFLGHYGKGMIVVWEDPVDSLRLITADGNLTQLALQGTGKVRARVLPVDLVNRLHTGYLHAMARNTLRDGAMGMGRFNPQKAADYYALEGLGAAAYFYRKYDLPEARKILEKAREAIDLLIASEERGVQPGWLFHIVHGATYLVRAGETQYKPWIRRWIERMHSPALLYDPETHTWPWFDYQVKNMRATYEAYRCFGYEKFRRYYENARASFEVRDEGIWWREELHPWSNNDTAAVLVGLLGYTEPDTAQQILNTAGIYINDFGMGPWGCSDINPKYTGSALASLGFDDLPKVFTRIGDFPIIVDGQVVLTRTPIVFFPHFPARDDLEPPIFDLPAPGAVTPGTEEETALLHGDHSSNAGPNIRWVADGGSFTYRFDLAGRDVETVLLRLGGAYNLETSGDGETWETMAHHRRDPSDWFPRREHRIAVAEHRDGEGNLFVRITAAPGHGAGCWGIRFLPSP